MSRKEINIKFDEIVAFSGVDKSLNTPVKRYSSGMYVRLAFSVASHLESDVLIIDVVLICDEPNDKYIIRVPEIRCDSWAMQKNKTCPQDSP